MQVYEKIMNGKSCKDDLTEMLLKIINWATEIEDTQLKRIAHFIVNSILQRNGKEAFQIKREEKIRQVLDDSCLDQLVIQDGKRRQALKQAKKTIQETVEREKDRKSLVDDSDADSDEFSDDPDGMILFDCFLFY